MGRSDVTFAVDGTRCSGWWYPAADGGDDADASSDDRRRPCVVMAHGLAAVKEMRLDAYAERFAAAGMFVFVFDYRGFGSSEGEPRQLLDIDAQHADWEAAVAYARTRPLVDGTRIVLWGSSLSGGHVLHLAQRVNAAVVIAQVPHTDVTPAGRRSADPPTMCPPPDDPASWPSCPHPRPPSTSTWYRRGSTSISGSPLGLASGSPATPQAGHWRT